MTKPKQKRGVQNSRTAFTPAPGAGVKFRYSNKARARKIDSRIELIGRVDFAVTQQDRDALIRLKRKCRDIPYLMHKITKALKG